MSFSLRKIVAFALGAAVLSIAVFAVLADWLLGDAAWLLAGLSAAAVAIAWGLIDRAILVRRHDRRGLPARPEFHERAHVARPLHGDELDGARPSALRYVVFDTETTGLRPAKGDEIISIAGVRLEDGAIDEDGAFTRLVNPGRTIPPGSIKFHGITEDMVAGEAPIGEVLPAFRDFAGDAILVAHNAEFDMAFLRMKQEQTGIVFDNLVLDTLLLSQIADPGARNHSLDSIAERLGVVIEGRHTALGDAVATAHILQKLLGRLEARGITTLFQIVEASRRVEDERGITEPY